MDDFVFTQRVQPTGFLGRLLTGISSSSYGGRINEFHGEWGSLAVSGSTYPGFATVETTTHICVVVGGPVLMFDIGEPPPAESAARFTHAILARWLSGAVDWSTDLAGPFVVLIVAKASGEFFVYTDLFLFTPCYLSHARGQVGVGTHIDVLARAMRASSDIDSVSILDFVLNGVVTYPHTVYNGIYQAHPAAEMRGPDGSVGIATRPYWLPEERVAFPDIATAASAIGVSFSEYVSKATRGMTQVAYLASGGEDSRVVASALPPGKERHAYVFVNKANREAAIAEAVAQRLRASFHIIERGESHYIDNFEAMATITGGGNENVNAHFVHLAEAHGLNEYDGVFGGYFADSILKGAAHPKRFPNWLTFLPELSDTGSRRAWQMDRRGFPEDLTSSILERRRSHYQYVQTLRPKSADEWFSIWPASMRQGNPNIASARRLFRSFEPFTSPGVIKAASATPIQWKLNRRLFRRAFKSNLRATALTPHSDGRLPYFPWWLNSLIQFPIYLSKGAKRIAAAFGLRRAYDGPWADWVAIAQSDALYGLAAPLESTYDEFFYSSHLGTLREALSRSSTLSIFQRIHLVQALITISQRDSDTDASA